MQRSNRLDL